MNPVAEIRTLARQLALTNLAQRPFDFLSEPVSNEQFLLDCIDPLWQNQLHEWHKAGTILGPKKHHRPVNWMSFDLVLTRKNRKKKGNGQKAKAHA